MSQGLGEPGGTRVVMDGSEQCREPGGQSLGPGQLEGMEVIGAAGLSQGGLGYLG